MTPHADPYDGKLTFVYGYRPTRLGMFQALPRLVGIPRKAGDFEPIGDRALRVQWRLGDGARLHLLAHLGPGTVDVGSSPEGRPLFVTPESTRTSVERGALGPWSVAWWLQPVERR
jgi:hypothetical protein